MTLLELPLKIFEADTFFLRAFGLLFRKLLQQGEALHLKPCNAVHTIGMRYSIDLVFFDHDSTIIEICNDVGRFRVRRSPAAHSVLEMRAGEASRLRLRMGMTLGETVSAPVNKMPQSEMIDE